MHIIIIIIIIIIRMTKWSAKLYHIIRWVDPNIISLLVMRHTLKIENKVISDIF